MRLAAWALISGLLAGCAAPPKPPSVDESRKRPANVKAEIEAETCRRDLTNTRIALDEAVKMADAATSAAHRATQMAMRAGQHTDTGGGDSPNRQQQNKVYLVLFPFNSSKLHLEEMDKRELIDAAKAAPFIVIRGRTDGETESLGESLIARQRANSVFALLLESGVPRERIRLQYQPVGDHVADNKSADGRTKNRRVEVELYSKKPVNAVLASSAPWRLSDASR